MTRVGTSSFASAEGEVRLALFLSKDTIFKPMMLSYILHLAKEKSVCAIVECGPNKGKKSQSLSPITEWGLFGTCCIAGEVFTKKLIHFICKRINLDQQVTLQGVAKKHQLPYLFSNNVNDSTTIDFVLQHGANTAVSFQHQRIENNSVAAFSKGFFNVHPSELPKYRGVKPIHWAAINNDSTFSVSLHSVGEKYDTGEIWVQQRLNLQKTFSIYEHYRASHLAAAMLVVKLVEKYEKLRTLPKNSSDKTHPYYTAPTKLHHKKLSEEGWIKY